MPKPHIDANDPRWARRRMQFVLDFQRAFGLPPDSLPGAHTFKKLAQLAKANGFEFEDTAIREYLKE